MWAGRSRFSGTAELFTVMVCIPFASEETYASPVGFEDSAACGWLALPWRSHPQSITQNNAKITAADFTLIISRATFISHTELLLNRAWVSVGRTKVKLGISNCLAGYL